MKEAIHCIRHDLHILLQFFRIGIVIDREMLKTGGLFLKHRQRRKIHGRHHFDGAHLVFGLFGIVIREGVVFRYQIGKVEVRHNRSLSRLWSL